MFYAKLLIKSFKNTKSLHLNLALMLLPAPTRPHVPVCFVLFSPKKLSHREKVLTWGRRGARDVTQDSVTHRCHQMTRAVASPLVLSFGAALCRLRASEGFPSPLYLSFDSAAAYGQRPCTDMSLHTFLRVIVGK